MEIPVSHTAPKLLLLSIAVTLAVTACKRDDAPAAAAAPTASAPAPALTLDESRLPPVNRFQFADLDETKNACVDFAGYVIRPWRTEVRRRTVRSALSSDEAGPEN